MAENRYEKFGNLERERELCIKAEYKLL